MRLGKPSLLLAAAIVGLAGSGLASAIPAAAAAGPAQRTVAYRGVRLKVPASWPVISLARHPRACPRLNVHAVYLGRPSPDPVCPPNLKGRTTAVVMEPARSASPDLRQATRSVVLGGRTVRTNPDAAVTHTIVDVIPSAGVEVSLSYGSSPAVARYIQSSLKVTGAARAVRSLRPAAIQPTAPQAVVKGPGFDTCAAPSAATMQRWLKSPYRAVGVYIGGVNRACSQANLTSAWLHTIQGEGWHYFPMYVGLQAPCAAGFVGATIKRGSAAAEGRTAADDAVTQATDLGIPSGTPIIFDMEAYRGGCRAPVISFLSAWDSELHVKGYVAGIYESFSNIGNLISAADTMTEPDIIHYADWDGHATTTSSYMPSDRWTNNQRIHQYQGGHNETWGGKTLNIDNDQLDVTLSGGTVPPPPPPSAGARRPGFRIAVAINGNGAAEWFARAANHTIRHNYQHPPGSSTWSATRAVGDSPADLASNPAAAADAGGNLTLFARTRAGQIVHAWQQDGAPNGWHWGGPVRAGRLRGRAVDDPAAIRAGRGEVALFVTMAGGGVMTTRQRAANDNTGWTGWASLGGRCASTPAPVVNGGRLEVFCTTSGGDLAVDTKARGAWSGWRFLTRRPGWLKGTPSAVVAGGRTEVFVTARSGRLEYAWQGARGWAWGPSPDPGRVRHSPAATMWPGGKVGVLAMQANGQLGYAVQEGTGGAGWTGWTPVGARLLGSPAAWTNTGGNPEAAILTGRLTIAVSSFAEGTWSAWTSLGGGY